MPKRAQNLCPVSRPVPSRDKHFLPRFPGNFFPGNRLSIVFRAPKFFCQLFEMVNAFLPPKMKILLMKLRILSQHFFKKKFDGQLLGYGRLLFFSSV